MQLYNPQYQYPQTGMAGTSSPPKKSSDGPMMLLLAAGAVAAFIWWMGNKQEPENAWENEVSKRWKRDFDNAYDLGETLWALDDYYAKDVLSDERKSNLRDSINDTNKALSILRKLKQEAQTKKWRNAVTFVDGYIEIFEKHLHNVKQRLGLL